MVQSKQSVTDQGPHATPSIPLRLIAWTLRNVIVTYVYAPNDQTILKLVAGLSITRSLSQGVNNPSEKTLNKSM